MSPLKRVERSVLVMELLDRLKAALADRYTIERELGEGSSWSFATGPCE